MSEINKVRVKGVLYDLGGSGGGTTGGVSGAWLAPGELVESGYVDSGENWDYMTIDPTALIDQLEKAGVDVDETPFLNSNESRIDIKIGRYLRPYEYNDVLIMSITANNIDMNIWNQGYVGTFGSFRNFSLKQLINTYFLNVHNLYCNVPSNSNELSALVNYVIIQYSSAHTTLKYYIPNMSEFCEEVFIEYTPSSE